jgi:predicted ATPase/class 3 adenylate cyclase
MSVAHLNIARDASCRMPDLPGGTVTFLFTDVEGSTRLLGEHGDDYADLLAEHRRLLRDAFSAHGGVEVDTQGDAFFVAFARASDAAAAALDGQRALEATPVRVRMGLHTGEPQVTDEGYVGMDVHRGARVAAAGHGGQVLVSEQTARLLDGTDLRDLGVHRLKDVGETRIYQLGAGEFPPLKTLYQTNLPAPSHPLIGRKKELVDVMRLLVVDRVRAVTITGPGGTGKTRFAIAAASDVTEAFADGTWFVDLSVIREAASVLPAVATAIGARGDVAGFVGDREVLVVLDNLEQVVDVAPELAGLVAACPRLQLLGTSREPLRIGAEHEYALKPLPESPAVELFRQRAAVESEVPYEVAAAICDRVDRLPLAIELAAARVRALEPAELLARLDQRLPLLSSRSRDLPERQRTLRSTIEWSWELLDAEEQQLFRRLSAFAGGARLEAAEAVCNADVDVLEALVDKSLVRLRRGRYVMLETVREFAAEQLEASGERDTIGLQHAEYFAALAATFGMSVDSVMRGTEQRHDLAEQEVGNVRTALAWSVGAGHFELATLLAVRYENFWVTHDRQEGIRWMTAVLEHEDELPPELLAPLVRSLGSSHGVAGDMDACTAAYERSLALYRALGDELGIAVMLHRVGTNRLFVDGDISSVRPLAEESLALHRKLGSTAGESQALSLVAYLARRDGNIEQAFALLERSIALARESGFRWWEANMLGELAEMALELGDVDTAAAAARRELELRIEMGDRVNAVYSLIGFAVVARKQGLDAEAGLAWGAVEAEEQRRKIVWPAERDYYVTEVLGNPTPAFETARSRGSALTVEEAVEALVGDG